MQQAEYRSIPLLARDGSIRAYTRVDLEDYPWLSVYTWRLLSSGYAVRKVGQEAVLMHRAILGLSRGDGIEADHINHDRLDNRRENLRSGPRKMNAQNRSSTGRLLPRGVYLHQGGRYQAIISHGGRNQCLGTFSTVREADLAAKLFRAEHFPFSQDAALAGSGRRV